jgi:Ca2+-transporting ATPase
VLAVARRRIPAQQFDPTQNLWQWADNWEFLGLAGLMDPPRTEAKQAIARCGEAGIQVKMITGDTAVQPPPLAANWACAATPFPAASWIS